MLEYGLFEVIMLGLQLVEFALETGDFFVELCYFGFGFLEEVEDLGSVDVGGYIIGVEICGEWAVEGVL